MNYFTADLHFFHEQLLQSEHFSPRPYDNLKDEHQGLQEAWNSRVTEQDTVYHLGDLAFLNKIKPVKKGYQALFELLLTLHGQIVLIKGNHDTRDLFKFLQHQQFVLADGRPKFEFHDVGMILKANHHQFFLTHYPLILGPTASSVNLHGHIHHSQVAIGENINVGIDSADLEYLQVDERPIWGAPLNLAEIEIILERKHHQLSK